MKPVPKPMPPEPSLKVEYIPIETIQIGEDRDPLIEETVIDLMESIKSEELRTPITVHDPGTNVVKLVAGRHRMEAYRRLGRPLIPSFVIEGNETQAKMWEISENLRRKELPALDRDKQLSAWVKLSRELQTAQAAPKESARKDKRGHRKKGGAREAARQLGTSKDDMNRALKVASLSPEAQETARKLGLEDNRSALLQASRADPNRQAQVLKNIADEKHAEVEAKTYQKDRKESAAVNAAELLHKFIPEEDREYMRICLQAAKGRDICNAWHRIEANHDEDMEIPKFIKKH